MNYLSDIQFKYDLDGGKLDLINSRSLTPINFYGNNIDPLNVIVGKNGVGKTKYMEYLCSFLGNYYLKSINIFQFFDEPDKSPNRIEVFYQKDVLINNKIESIDINGVSFKITYKGFEEDPSDFYNLIEKRFQIIYLTNALSNKSFFPQKYCLNESTTFLIEQAKSSDINPSLNPLITKALDNIVAYNLRELKRQLRVFKENPEIPQWVFGKDIKTLGVYFDSTIMKSEFSWMQLVLNKLSFNKNFKIKIETLAKNKTSSENWVTSSDNDLKKLFLYLMMYFKNKHITEQKDIKTKQFSSIIYKMLPTEPIEDINKAIREELRGHTINEIQDLNEIEEFLTYISKDEVLSKMQIQLNLSDYTLASSFIDFFSVQYEINLDIADDFIDKYFELLGKESMKIMWFTWGFSSGELALMALFARILAHSNQIGSDKTVLLLLDEAEMYLHPEWQQKFILKYLIFLQKVLKNHRIQLLLATHSPIILSDCTHEYVNYIHKDTSGESVMERNDNKIFGAPIYSLFRNLFFLDEGFIGEFSEDRINGLIDYLIPKDYNPKIPFELDDTSFQTTMNLLGDNLVFTKIMEHFLLLKKGDEEFAKRIKKKYDERNNLFKDLDI